MQIIMVINYACQLGCNFCGRASLDKKELQRLAKQEMTVATFKKAVDTVTANGVDTISLTSVIGDPLLHPSLLSMLDYCEQHPKVKHFGFTTNFLAVSSLLLRHMLAYKKFSMTISLYGSDRESYKAFTNRDMFTTFSHNLVELASGYVHHKSSIGITFGMRIHPTELKGQLKAITKAMTEFSDDIRFGEMEHEHHNFCSHIKKEGTTPLKKVRTKACHYMVDEPAVYPDGAIGYCATDIYVESRIGNIFSDTWEEIFGPGSKYHNILGEQNRGIYRGACAGCTSWKDPDHVPVYPVI
jgi:sulfatase maturation enzyme AslB (radical SAM superfamily)